MITVVATVLGGVCIYVIGQIVLKFLIEPISELKKTIGGIADFLVYHADRYANVEPISQAEGENSVDPKESRLAETSRAARTLASELVVRVHMIPAYRRLSRVCIVPGLERIERAYNCLLYTSDAADE